MPEAVLYWTQSGVRQVEAARQELVSLVKLQLRELIAAAFLAATGDDYRASHISLDVVPFGIHAENTDPLSLGIESDLIAPSGQIDQAALFYHLSAALNKLLAEFDALANKAQVSTIKIGFKFRPVAGGVIERRTGLVLNAWGGASSFEGEIIE